MMDMGQITQDLRTDVLNQASGQGINVAQMMENGVSFADIMLLILQNTQSIANGQGIPLSDMPQMNTEASGQSNNTMLAFDQINDNKSVLDQAGQSDYLKYQNDMLFMPDAKNFISNIQDNTNKLDDENFISNFQDNPNMLDMDKLDIETPKFLYIQNETENLKNSDMQQDIKNSDDSQNVSNNAENYISRNSDQLTENTPKHDFSFTEDMPIWSVSNENTADRSSVDRNTVDRNPVDRNQAEPQINSMAEKLSDLFELVSPEFAQVSDKNSSLMNNNFVMDLLSQLDTEEEVKDSFDFSESMIKIDPMQLTGLLDYISTGNDIPQAMDIPDSHMFENIENLTSVKAPADKITFDPEEMIKSGEMEIISYVPAKKNAESSNNQAEQSEEKVIDIARRMKDIKENVKSELPEEISDFSKAAAQTANVNPDELAQKRDISFERAYAELEMNKAKYGSADKQLYEGISKNLERGRSEFTVKLRPEGLGEILVKLVSNEGGKAILTMVASSEKTAELLNRDLASLQTSLNQHNVEIENNSVKVAETVMHSQTAFDQYNERQQDEAYQQQHFRQLKKKIGDISDRNVSFDVETEPVTAAVADSALNITI